MITLPFHIRALFFLGLWNENITYPFLYSIYKFLVSSIISLFAISLLTQFLRTCGSDDDALHGLFIAAPFIPVVARNFIFILFIKKVKNLLKLFQLKTCQPNSKEEWTIWNNCRKNIDTVFWSILIYTVISASTLLFLPVMHRGLKTLTLPFNTYQPYKISQPTSYYLTYMFQIVASYYGVLFNVTADTMAYGIILLICAQYDIYCLRLSKMGMESQIYNLKYYVNHHVVIQNCFSSAQDFFMMGITPLFCCSLITLGASILNVIQVTLFSAEFFTMVIFFVCMLTQIFLYCWYGNILIEKSTAVTNAIYNCTWTDLSVADKRNLRFIMQFSTKGNVLSHHGQCVLNLNTFVWIVKASYTALNVLKRSAN